jgi:oligopeptide/dipeptide ABC transporter ATP-binding protein
VKAVDGVSFTVERGQIHALVGESGCGKSTVLRAILRLVDVYSGRIVFDNVDITNRGESDLKWYRRRVQAVFQNPQGSLNPRMRVFDIIAEPLRLHLKIPREEVLSRVHELTRLVGLPESILDQSPQSLSGGQAQRVAIARAISIKPDLLLLDEPTSALDVSTQAQILNLLLDLKEKLNLSYILVTHDISVARYMADTIGVMYLGKIVEKGSADAILSEPLHPYTKLLISSALLLEEKSLESTLKPIGEPPSAINPPPGCRFHPRCPYATEKCKREEPPLVTTGKEHFVACWLYV